MVVSNDQYLSNSLEYVYKPEIGQRTKFTANTGSYTMTTGNSNLDGSTGTFYTILSCSSTNGTKIKTITIKAATTLTKGMVRLFINDNATVPFLISEIEIPARSQETIQESFAISLDVDFILKNGWDLNATTENTESIVVWAEGLDLSYP